MPRLVLLSGLLTAAALSCGFLEDDPTPTPTPNSAQSLGREIAETYGRLMLHAKIIVELRPPASEAKTLLRGLREEYKVHFGNYACLRDTLSGAEQMEVASAFDANRDAFLPPDMSWFEDAASDYDFEDTAIRALMEEIATLDDYAFLERVAVSRPGEELLCG